jgi:DNA-binding NarL/FixJ family response regulator
VNYRCTGISRDQRCWLWATKGPYCDAHQPPDEDKTDVELTPRERQVLALTVAGFSIRDIGGQLGVSERTAKYFSDCLRRKFGVDHRRELIRVGQTYLAGAEHAVST